MTEMLAHRHNHSTMKQSRSLQQMLKDAQSIGLGGWGDLAEEELNGLATPSGSGSAQRLKHPPGKQHQAQQPTAVLKKRSRVTAAQNAQQQRAVSNSKRHCQESKRDGEDVHIQATPKHAKAAGASPLTPHLMPSKQQRQLPPDRKHDKQQQHLKHSNENEQHRQEQNKKQGCIQQPVTDAAKQALDWPFPTDFCDHFETGVDALADLAPCLALLSQALGQAHVGQLILYDPYFCTGSIRARWASLGFTRLIHRNRDFYADVHAGRVPQYDILITNPPYSADHKQRILSFCIHSGRPWALLMPSYVANKGYFSEAMASLGSASSAGRQDKPGQGRPSPAGPSSQAPFFLVPARKYEYEHPEGAGHASSPFFSIWFVHLGSHTGEILPKLQAQLQQEGSPRPGGSRGSNGRVRLVMSVAELQAGGAAPSWTRPNPRQRKKRRAGREGG